MPIRSRYADLVKGAVNHEARASRLAQIRETATPDVADRVGRLYRHYPWVAPGVLLSLARFGAEPSSETAQLASVLDARRRDLSPLGWSSPGDRVPAAMLDVESRQRARLERAQEWVGVTARGSATIGGAAADDFSGSLDPNLARAQASQERSRVAAVEAPLDPAVADQSGFGAAAQLAGRAATGTVRGGMAVMASPLQGVTGNFRNLVDVFHPPDDAEVRPNPLLALGASAMPGLSVPLQMVGVDPATGFDGGQTQTGQIVRQAVTDVRAGETPDIDLGSGFFVAPDSRVEQARRRQELRRGTIGGSAITPGRVVAYEVVEPGTRPYTVISGITDAAVAMWADPTNAVLGGTSAARAANRELMSGPATGSGLINASRRTVDVDQVRNWLDSPGFRDGFGSFAAGGDYRAIREATKGRLPAEVEVALADATTTDEVVEILMPHVDEAGRPTGIGYDLRHPQDTLRVPGTGAALRRATGRVRAFNMMPSDTWRLDDASAMVEDTERFLRNIKATDDEVATWAERVARTEPGIRGRNQRFGVLKDLMGSTEGVLVTRFGVDEELASELTRMFDDAMEDHRVFALDFAGGHVTPAWADPAIAGADAEDVLEGIGPLTLTQHTNGLVPMPDTRALRRLTSPEWEQRFTLARLMRERQAMKQGTQVPLNTPIAMALAVQDKVWKPFQLLRAAWVTRVVGEEQFRLVADGLEGFNHPAAWVAWATQRSRRSDVLGDPFTEADQFADAMASGSMGFRDLQAGQVRTVGAPRSFARDATAASDRTMYNRWWANEVARRASDPLSQRVANSLDDLDSVKDWFFYPGNNELYDVMVDAHPALANRSVADAYIEQLADDIRVLAGANPDAGIPANDRVLAAMRDGHWTADDGTRVALNNPGEARVSNDFIAALRTQRDTGPVRVAGRDVIPDEPRNGVVDWLFGMLGAKPTNFLSRSPGFRQFYWQRMEEMIPLLTAEAQEAAIEGAARAGLGRQQIRRLREFASRGTGEAGLLEADDLAKWHALDDTRNLLYDLSERSQFFDIHRLIFPFGEAWQEVLTRWATLLRKNPRMIRRFQQGITEARNQGMFFQDENGEESFAYPATRAMLNLVGVNAPTRLVGSAQGLNMAGQIMPGVGPMVQMPAAALLPDTREWRPVRDVILPFGEEQSSSAFRTFFPPWAERLVQAGASEGEITVPTTFGNRQVPGPLRDAIRHAARWLDDDADTRRTYNTSVNMVMAQLASTGEYGPSPADQRRLVRDARDQATTLTFFRAISSFFAPSAPRPEYSAEVNDDQTAVIATLSEEFYELQDEGMSWDAAMRDMLDRYGNDNLVYALTGKTVSTSVAAPVTREAGEWDAANPFARTRYPAVFGLFAPQDGEFDYSVYSGEFDMGGTRAGLTPEQFNTAAQSGLAQLQWEEAKRQAGPETDRPPEMDQWLRDTHEWLSERYEGWENEAGVPGSPTLEESIEQLERASADEDLAEAAPGAMEGLRSYLTARSQAQQFLEEGRANGLFESSGFESSKETAPLRDWLRGYADWVIRRNPEFQLLWDRVFSRELKDAAVEENE